MTNPAQPWLAGVPAQPQPNQPPQGWGPPPGAPAPAQAPQGWG
jgi:hypothetical protein